MGGSVRSGCVVRDTIAREAEQPAKMSFADEVVEAVGELVDAKIDYAETRRGPAAECANRDPVYKAEARLTALLAKVRFAI